MYNMKFISKINILLLVTGFTILSGCQKNWLEEQPLTQLSDASFWHSESDAKLALTGVYQVTLGKNYDDAMMYILFSTDDARFKQGAAGASAVGQFQIPTNTSVIKLNWTKAYQAIFRANVFLENISKVTMDETKKAQFIAEVRFLRAREYFWLSQWFGGVPLVTKILSISEANNQTRNSREEIEEFCLNEFTAAAADLPFTRVDSERGRVIKSAALAEKGRLLMIKKRWPEAAASFKEIIDANVHIIDPRYKTLFEAAGETSKEIILACNYVAGSFGNNKSQKNFHPAFYGGYQEDNAFQDLIDAFLMKDGLPISESPLYDPQNPFANRDPRLYASMFLPEYTVFRGQLYLADPSLTNFGIKQLNGATGYVCKKFVTENFTGDRTSAEDDVYFIRYAEVLLGYLESKLEAGDPVSQDLLDQTINKVRGRAEVSMPPVTETNPDKLRDIIRRERRVEFVWEPLIRWMDIHRWGITAEVVNKKFYGMKLRPVNYGTYPVDATGHLFVIDKTGFYEQKHELWPIPLSEIDINPNLQQNPGY
jgi:hypothetical protein